jgi:hypothetical protein
MDAGEAGGEAEGTRPQRGVLRQGGQPDGAGAAAAGDGSDGGGRARVRRAGARCWRRGLPEPRQTKGRSQAAGKVKICNSDVISDPVFNFHQPPNRNLFGNMRRPL